MDSFIFKGKSSEEFNGIVVNSLPPISKPPKRVTKTEIEGKDGDIIEFLGYEAYDKSIEITILEETDIDQLIDWLNGSGKLILSNEPTKYYNAEIIEQIDFSRLVKYEPIEIKFHIQPYKYLVNEEIEEVEIDENTNSVSIINNGFIESKPIVTLYGTGSVEIYINDSYTFTVNIDDENVTIDSIKEDAYKGITLKNRQMHGEFDKIKLQPGENVITWTGNLTKIEIEPKSRWL